LGLNKRVDELIPKGWNDYRINTSEKN